MSTPDGTADAAAPGRVETVVDLAWTTVVPSSRPAVLFDQDAPNSPAFVDCLA